MSLRDDLLKKTGVSSTASPTPNSGSAAASTTREALLSRVDIPVKSTQNVKAEPVKTAREALLEKSTAPVVAKQEVKPIEPPKDLIASPEYFAKSLDVRGPTGKLVEVFKGDDAYEKATAKASEIGGKTEVTPRGGFVGRAINRAVDTVKGAFNELTDRSQGLIDTITADRTTPGQDLLKGSAEALRTGVAGVNVLFAPISGVFTAAEEVPVLKYPAAGINYLFGKIGEAGDWAGGKVVDSLPISDSAKATIKPAAEELSALLAQIAGGKAIAKGSSVLKEKTEATRNKIKEEITKDVIVTHNLPKTVYIDGAKLKDIFQTGEKLSPDELNMVKSLGLDTAQYKKAFNDGLSIAVPAEKIVTITDKPYFAKIKSALGIESVPQVKVIQEGLPKTGPRALLEAPVESLTRPRIQEDVPENVQTPQIAEKTSVTRISDVVPESVRVVSSEPITSKTMETIAKFTPQEFSAFGRKIVDGLNREAGTKITNPQAREAGLPDSIDVLETQSPDGRPAQFQQGRIQVFLPDLVRDIKALAEGKKILAHGGENAKVYKMNEGESFEQLSLRYTKDVLVHELSHEKTVNLEDNTKIQQLRQEVLQARQSGNQAKIVEANTKMQKFMESLETKALEYERGNRKALEDEIFTKEPTSTQRAIDKSFEKEPTKLLRRRREEALLKIKLKNQEVGSKAGLRAGIKEGVRIGEEKVKNVKEGFKNLLSTKIVKSEKSLLKDKFRNQALGARAGKQEGIEVKQKELEVVKLGFKDTLEKLKDKVSSQQQKRQALVEYAEAFLPVSERGKFIRSIRYVGSDKEFLNVLGRMQEASKSVERKEVKQQIVKELKNAKTTFKDGKPNPKFEVEAQRKLNRIIATQRDFEAQAKALRDNGESSANAYQLAQIEIANIIDEFQTKNPSDVLSSEIVGRIQELKMVGINEMNLEELRSALADIKSIKETGRTLRELEVQKKEEKRIVARKNHIDIISEGKALPSSKFVIRPKEDVLGIMKALKQGTNYLINDWGELTDILSFGDKKTGPYQSYISKYGRVVKAARSNEILGVKEQTKKYLDGMKESYGIKTDNEMLKKLESLQKIEDLGEFTDLNGNKKTLQLSHLGAVRREGWMRDESLEASFINEGWTPEMKEAVLKFMTPEDFKFSDFRLQKFYKEYGPRINKVHVESTGADLVLNNEGTYSPAPKQVESTLPESQLLAKQNLKYATARNGSLKKRVQNNLELNDEMDALAADVTHIDAMEHYIAWQPKLDDLRAVYANKEVRQNINEFFGTNIMKSIDNNLVDMARGGIDPALRIKPIDFIRTNGTVAMLGIFATVKVPLKQLVGSVNFMMELNAKEYFGGVKDFWKNPIRNYKFMLEQSPLLKARYEEGFDLIMKEALAKGYDKKVLNASTFTEAMFIGIRNADKITTIPGSYSAYLVEYNKAIKEGVSKEEATKRGIEYAEDVVDRTQEASHLYTQSEFQRAGSIARTLSMFTSQPVKINRSILSNFRNLRAGRGDKSQRVRNIIASWMTLPLIYNLFADQLAPEGSEKETEEIVARTFLGPLTYIPLLGSIAQGLTDKMFGSRFDFSISPALGFVDSISNGIEKLTLNDPKVVDAMTYFVEAAGQLKGVPVRLFTKEVRDVMKEIESGESQFPEN